MASTPVPHEQVPPDPPLGWWWACEQPERPPRHGYTYFDIDGCADCARIATVLGQAGDPGYLLDLADRERYPLTE